MPTSYQVQLNNKGQWCLFRGDSELIAIVLEKAEAHRIKEALEQVAICPRCGSRIEDGQLAEVAPCLEL